MVTLGEKILTTNDGSSVTFMYREGSEGDEGVMGQIFGGGYDINGLDRADDILSAYHNILSSGRVPLIIDCGANIGASPVWFAMTFSHAGIVAIEPEANNFDILRMNCRHFPNIQPERAAVSCKEETLYIHDPGEGGWGFQTTRSNSEPDMAVPAVSIDSILKRYPDAELFWVKIDIEGGESRMFEENIDWIGKTTLITIELHDYAFPGDARSRNFLKAIAPHDRDFVCRGENIFSIKN